LGNEAVKQNFFELMAHVPEFQTDVLLFLADDPERPVQVVVQHLCDECGPMSGADKYILEAKCRRCGKEQSIDIY
jgi:hypothetical protein